MTGLVSWETLLWIIGVMSACGATVAGFLLWVYRLVKGLQKEAESRTEKRDLKVLAVQAAAETKAEVLAKELVNFRIHVSETFATKHGTSATLDRLEKNLDSLSLRVDEGFLQVSGRIDRLLELRSHPATRARSAT